MSTNGSGAGKRWRLDLIEEETEGVEETAERSPSAVTDVVIANFARLVEVVEEMGASWATLVGNGLSEGVMGDWGCTDGGVSVTGAGPSMGRRRGESSLAGWAEYVCDRCGWSSTSECWDGSWGCCCWIAWSRMRSLQGRQSMRWSLTSESGIK
jgi:hypothetical protein